MLTLVVLPVILRTLLASDDRNFLSSGFAKEFRFHSALMYKRPACLHCQAHGITTSWNVIKTEFEHVF